MWDEKALSAVNANVSLEPISDWEFIGNDVVPYIGGFPTAGIALTDTGASDFSTDYMRKLVVLPNAFTAGNVTLKVIGFTAATGNVQMRVRWVCNSSGANFYSPTFSSIVDSNIVAGTATTTTSNVWTMTLDLSSGCAIGDYLHVEIARNNGVASNMANYMLALNARLYQ